MKWALALSNAVFLKISGEVQNKSWQPTWLAKQFAMPLKKVDNRVRTLVENGVSKRYRSLFVVVGDHGRDQVSDGRGPA